MEIEIAMFLKNGNKVFSVEPNDEMRTAAETALSGYSNFYGSKGTAENTGLQDKVADIPPWGGMSNYEIENVENIE